MPNERLEIEGGLEECYRKSHTLELWERSADYFGNRSPSFFTKMDDGRAIGGANGSYGVNGHFADQASRFWDFHLLMLF